MAFEEMLSLMVFLDKPTGGKRPIFLIMGVLRVWSCIRSDICRSWEQEHAEPFCVGSRQNFCENRAETTTP